MNVIKIGLGLESLSDILTKEDLDNGMNRIKQLSSLLELPEGDISLMVTRYPLLLSMEEEKISKAVAVMRCQAPFINPTFLLQQRSPGIELLVACTFPTFNLTREMDEISAFYFQAQGTHARTRVVNMRSRNKGKAKDQKAAAETSGLSPRELVEDFVRRAPHVLAPRFKSALYAHTAALEEKLHLAPGAALHLVVKWPGLLSLRNIHDKLNILNASLVEHDMPNDLVFIRALVQRNPRVLHKDMGKRVDSLRTRFPRWNLGKVARQNPRVFTQHLSSLQKAYEGLVAEFGEVCDVDALVNALPSALHRRPTTLRANVQALLLELPNCSEESLLNRVPRLVASDICVEVGPKIKTLRRIFTRSDAATARDAGVTKDTKIESCISEDTATVVNIWAPVPDTDANTNAKEGYGEDDVTTTTDHATATTAGAPLDMTRIVMGNAKLLVSNFARLRQGTKRWVDEYALTLTATLALALALSPSPSPNPDPFPDPDRYSASLAYTLLDALPSLVTDTPGKSRDVVKFLYNLCAEASIEGQASELKTSASSLLYAPQELLGLHNPRHAAIHTIVRAAPTVFRTKASDLELRKKWLYDVLGLPWYVEFGEAGPRGQAVKNMFRNRLFVHAPRVLVADESQLEFRILALTAMLAGSDVDAYAAKCTCTGAGTGASHQRLECLLSRVPRLLTAPTAVLARVHFVDRILPESLCTMSEDRLHDLFTTSTEDFLCHLEELLQHAQGVSTATGTMSVRERYCTLLEDVCTAMERPCRSTGGVSGTGTDPGPSRNVATDIKNGSPAEFNEGRAEKTFPEMKERQLCRQIQAAIYAVKDDAAQHFCRSLPRRKA